MAVGLHLSNNWSNVVLVGTKGDVLKPVAPFVAETPDLARITTIIALQTSSNDSRTSCFNKKKRSQVKYLNQEFKNIC